MSGGIQAVLKGPNCVVVELQVEAQLRDPRRDPWREHPLSLLVLRHHLWKGVQCWANNCLEEPVGQRKVSMDMGYHH